ncbi:fluoride efflux transporter FluC [Weissella soli]|uniref:fluoride efflux transporter FluC n=1 Tax=Weissella soli TaxID=155866 RepID=UPI001F18704D|nr:CrcB family protein [Weissella soli]MCT8394701.1 CrcB family protein [Weissella soli]GJM48095.1 hypothetical protein WSSLDB02_06520 [Weissella soli]
MTMKTILAVGLGGIIGGGLRELIELVMANAAPVGTIMINLTGTFLSALAVVLIAGNLQQVTQVTSDFVLVGILGAFTTYSSMLLEMVKYPIGVALAEVSISIIGGVIAVFLARWLGGKLVKNE